MRTRYGNGFRTDGIDVALPLLGANVYVERNAAPVEGAHVALYRIENGVIRVLHASGVTGADGVWQYRTLSLPAADSWFALAYTPNYSHGTTGSADIDTPLVLAGITQGVVDHNLDANWYAKPMVVAMNGISANLQAPGNIVLYAGDFIQTTGGDITRVWFYKVADYAGADVGTGVNLAGALGAMSGLTFDCDDYAASPVMMAVSVGNPAWWDHETWEAQTTAEIGDNNQFCGA